jgi:serine/threonine-protein phosphatase 2A regulatory subunit B
MQIVEKALYIPNLQKTYPNLHNYSINAISLSSNEEFLLSSDDLSVYLWSIERPDVAFGVLDMKPDNLEELSEVITSSQFHPKLDTMFLFTTSTGIIKIGDMRKKGICDNTAMVLAEKQDESQKNFFTEIVSSISDACFSKDGRYVYSRDFLTMKVWDLHMANKPVSTI